MSTPPSPPTISFPQPIIAIIGESGSGKSTSLRNLDWSRTKFIDVEAKGLPFDYSGIKYYSACKSTSEVTRAIIDAKKQPEIRYIVIDSITKFFEYNLAECKASYKNYEIYNAYNQGVSNLLNSFRDNNKIFIVTGIPENLRIMNENGVENNQRRLFVHGKEWEGKVEKEFLVVFYTTSRKGQDGKMTYSFITNSDGVCSAKTPMGMFASQLIPNDLAEALKVIDKNNK